MKMECRVNEVKSLGDKGGAGNLVICEVLRIHIADELTDADGKLDQRKMKHVARLGGDWYCVVDENNLVQVEKPNTKLGIGFDNLPHTIRYSNLLSGNHLGQLANVDTMPVINPAFDDDHLKQIIQYYNLNPEEMETELHRYAGKLLNEGKIEAAWQVLLSMG